MRRILVLVLVVVLTMLAIAFASPAFADGRSASAPNCEDGQFSAAYAQSHNASPHDDWLKHQDKIFEPGVCGFS